MRTRWDGSRITQGSVESTRPREPARLLIGLPIDRALGLLPSLFAICGRAQSIAGALATECARGIEPAGAMRALRLRRIAAESVHEHLWRVLLDWPGAIGEDAAVGEFSAIRPSLLADDLDWPAARRRVRGLIASHVFATDPGDWRRSMLDGGFDDWLRGAATPAARLLARLRAAAARFAPRRIGVLPPEPGQGLAIAIARRLDADEGFAAAPSWNGSTRETGVLARHVEDPLLGSLEIAGDPPPLLRFVARLLALETLTATDDPPVTLGAIALSSPGGDANAAKGASAGDAPVAHRSAGGTGEAIAWVDTARGLLVHRVGVVDDAIHRYRIVAPTEWNFHPQGALASELPGLCADDEPTLRQRIALLIQSLDPCVGFTVEIGHA